MSDDVDQYVGPNPSYMPMSGIDSRHLRSKETEQQQVHVRNFYPDIITDNTP